MALSKFIEYMAKSFGLSIHPIARMAYLLSLGFILLACNSNFLADPLGKKNPEKLADFPKKISGVWLDPSGITSSFHDGKFETRSADTNEKLAEGNYILYGKGSVDIEMRSLVRGTVSRVNCVLKTATSLQCAAPNGAQFILTRKPS